MMNYFKRKCSIDEPINVQKSKLLFIIDNSTIDW